MCDVMETAVTSVNEAKYKTSLDCFGQQQNKRVQYEGSESSVLAYVHTRTRC